MNASDPRRHAVASISCGRDHTLALLADGTVFGWGGDGSGRIPSGAPEYCSTAQAPTRAVEVRLRERLVGIAAGQGVSLGIAEGGHVVAWGATAAGIGGRLASIGLAEPQRLAGVEHARAVAAGEFLSGAIDMAGGVHTWGLNVDGAL